MLCRKENCRIRPCGSEYRNAKIRIFETAPWPLNLKTKRHWNVWIRAYPTLKAKQCYTLMHWGYLKENTLKCEYRQSKEKALIKMPLKQKANAKKKYQLKKFFYLTSTLKNFI